VAAAALHGTTIVGVLRDGRAALAGDGQVTLGQQTIMKRTARKVRRLYHGRVLAGFAGSVADALALFERFETRLEAYHGNLPRAAVELAKEWRTDRALRRLDALLIVMDLNNLLILSGTGEVIEPDDGVAAVGSAVPSPWPRPGPSSPQPALRRGDRPGEPAHRLRYLCLHQRSDHRRRASREGAYPLRSDPDCPWLKVPLERTGWSWLKV